MDQCSCAFVMSLEDIDVDPDSDWDGMAIKRGQGLVYGIFNFSTFQVVK